MSSHSKRRHRSAPAKQIPTVSATPTDAAVVPYDEHLLERTRTQWQFGDWESLIKIDRNTLQHHPDRAKLALLTAAGHLQTGNQNEAMQYIRLAKDWGCSNKLILQILAAGVHNSLGRAAAINNQKQRALQHFKNAIAIGTPGSDTKLLTQARTGEQLSQLGLSTPEGYLKVGAGETASGANSQPLSPDISSESANEKYANFSSGQYWEERYQKGGTSGYGSYGRLAEFKAQIINKFIVDEKIERLIEFGCGDGNQLSMLRIYKYVGVDISPTVVQMCKEKFKDDPGKTFYTNEEFKAAPLKAELTLSLDVIFYLIEDNVFEAYMFMLFDTSEKCCIIYGCDSDERIDPAVHVRHRKFTEWVSKNIKNWRLSKIYYNKYRHDDSVNPKDKSFSDFYFYERFDSP